MDDLKQILARPIQLAEQVIKWSDEAYTFRQECMELKAKVERLAGQLRQAARADLYERPARRIFDDTEKALDKAMALVDKCRAHGVVRRVFTIIPAGSFKKMANQLDNSIGDLSWLLRVSSSASDDDDFDAHIGLPPIAQNEPILFLIWEQIAVLYTGNLDARADAAASLVSLARDNDRYSKLIIEEDGVPPLLRLVKEGKLEGQENAALAIGLLGRDPECVEQMVHAGACTAFAKVLKEGPMKVQATVAWAVSELAANHPKCQDAFASHNVIRLLVGHLAFETVQEHSKYAVTSSKMSIHSVVMDKKNSTRGALIPDLMDAGEHGGTRHPGGHVSQSKNEMYSLVHSTMAAKPNGSSGKVSNGGVVASKQHNVSLSGATTRGREFEDPETKASMKANAAKALWHLAKGNAAICKSITESRALLCFAVLLEKGEGDVQYNSAMALMEICSVAEQNSDLRRSAFKPTSPAARAVVDQLLRVVDKAEYDDLLIPCIISLGCLSRTFRATETRIIGPLVKLLDEREADVSREAALSLTKFACTENYLRVDHSKAIISAGGAKHLVQLVYFSEQVVQLAALALVCYIAHNVPDSEELAQAEILTVLEWASKQSFMMQDPLIESLLPEAKIRLELYQSRDSAVYLSSGDGGMAGSSNFSLILCAQPLPKPASVKARRINIGGAGRQKDGRACN
ncbi:Os09g0536200 [Oryza sativa Japonica Group]|uniref:Os09g0536200 protein n=1 Tax=Oryza sativa subsp. japonica TaxID=39947 RepID=Q0J017_ORYSJ|nr:Os09g0536200 [Oryza sativa Japonica Group]|eukprot:NP_001063784.2 Os09g0536200 [Oryza sativa Japonica Group]